MIGILGTFFNNQHVYSNNVAVFMIIKFKIRGKYCQFAYCIYIVYAVENS